MRPTREGVLVYILALEYQLANKVAAADVMHQVAEFPASKWVVAEVLNDRTSVSIGVRFFDLVVRETGKTLEQEGADLVSPQQVDDLLVRENRVRGQAAAA